MLIQYFFVQSGVNIFPLSLVNRCFSSPVDWFVILLLVTRCSYVTLSKGILVFKSLLPYISLLVFVCCIANSMFSTKETVVGLFLRFLLICCIIKTIRSVSYMNGTSQNLKDPSTASNNIIHCYWSCITVVLVHGFKSLWSFMDSDILPTGIS